MARNLHIFTGLTMASTPACSFQASSTSSLSLSPSLSRRRRRPLTTSLGSYSGRRMPANYQGICRDKVRAQCSNSQLTIAATTTRGYKEEINLINRRNMIGFIFGVSSLVLDSFQAEGAGLPPEEKPRLCDDSCEKELENVPMVTTESGLQYKDIKVGQGLSPPVGFQVAANYVAMVPSGQIFDSSLEKGQLYIFRVGSDQVIKGLDEGILTMKVGGKRRLYIPGSLAFPKGLTSAPGRPRVAPSSPVVFDVSLEYVPGSPVHLLSKIFTQSCSTALESKSKG